MISSLATMASSAASMAASRVLNIRNSSLRILLHRHLRPAAAATSTPHIINNNISKQEQLLFNPVYSERRSLDSVYPLFDMKNLNTDAENLPRNLQHAIGFSAHKIEADRRRGPVEDEDSDVFGDSDYDDDDDDDDCDDDDDDCDDDDIHVGSGSKSEMK